MEMYVVFVNTSPTITRSNTPNHLVPVFYGPKLFCSKYTLTHPLVPGYYYSVEYTVVKVPVQPNVFTR